MSHVINGDSKVLPCVLGGVAVGAALGLGLAHLVCPSWCKAGKPQHLKLMYFDGRGLAEVARQMLAVAGVSFQDKRYPFTIRDGDGPVFTRIEKKEMDADAAAGLFQANMGRLPLLKADGLQVGGSKAIYRYIARTYGLNGKTSTEAAQIDTVCEIMSDIADAFSKQEDKEKWFNTSSKDGCKQGERQLQWFLEQLEKLVGKDGFAVGGTVSMADAVLYNKLGERCTTKGLFGSPDSQPMGNGAKVDECLARCAPRVALIVSTFGSLPRMQAYLKQRATHDQWF